MNISLILKVIITGIIFYLVFYFFIDSNSGFSSFSKKNNDIALNDLGRQFKIMAEDYQATNNHYGIVSSIDENACFQKDTFMSESYKKYLDKLKAKGIKCIYRLSGDRIYDWAIYFKIDKNTYCADSRGFSKIVKDYSNSFECL